MLKSLVIILLLPWIQAQTCRSSYSQPNMKILDHVVQTYSMQTRDQCTDKCALHADCHSINYYSSQGICELNNANHLTNPESLVYSAGSQYLDYFLRRPSRCSNKLCSYPLVCEIDENGYKCLPCQDKRKVLSFPYITVTDYVAYENPFVQLTAFTISMWVQVDASTDFHTPFSYATSSQDNEILFVLRKTTVEQRIDDHLVSFSSALIDGQWHHICLTWVNTDGSYTMYIDGINKAQGAARKINHVIPKGVIILGQEQDAYKGQFEAAQSFQGNLTGVNMWDKVLTANEVSGLAANKCSTPEGNVIKWKDFQDKIKGNVKPICPLFCNSD